MDCLCKPLIRGFDNIKIGCHCSPESTLYDTVKKFDNLYCMQIYTGNPQSYYRRNVPKNDVLNINKYIDKYDMSLVSHAPLIINLACQDLDKRTKAISSLQSELDIYSVVKGKVVVHIGKVGSIQDVISSINKLKLPSEKYKLLLENAAGQGTELGTSLAEIKEILDNVDEKVGVCIDTCHIFAAGQYNISKVDEVHRLFKDFNDRIGIEKLKLIHLNDSKKDFCSRVDRHENIYSREGFIWGKSLNSLYTLIEYINKYDIPCILETPNCYNDFLFLNNLLTKE